MDDSPLSLRMRSALFSLALCLCIACSQQVMAQSIRIVRSDVDSGRSSFITATQLFGMDIVVSGVKNCTAVSFELQYQGSQYVVFSDWKARDLGYKGTFAYDLSDTAKGTGSVHVGALAGIAISDPGVDNPVAVHLDFVVRPNAPNALPLSFSFVHAQAVTSDSGGKIVALNSGVYSVSIHGFVKVWPGDADNNGIVDSRDATTVGAYLKQGSGASNVRGYKRDPASTLWLPQEALVWDSSKATYADCDGSGDVTLSDNLVVQINFSQLHSIMVKHDNVIQRLILPQYLRSLPRQDFSLSTPTALLGAAFALRFAPGSELPIGFESADPDVQPSLFLPDPDAQTVYLVFGNENGNNSIRSGKVGTLVYPSQVAGFSSTEALGATRDGRIFPLSMLSNVGEDAHQESNDLVLDNNAELHAPEAFRWLSISTLLGSDVCTLSDPSATQTSYSLAGLPNGIYAVQWQSAHTLYRRIVHLMH